MVKKINADTVAKMAVIVGDAAKATDAFVGELQKALSLIKGSGVSEADMVKWYKAYKADGAKGLADVDRAAARKLGSGLSSAQHALEVTGPVRRKWEMAMTEAQQETASKFPERGNWALSDGDPDQYWVKHKDQSGQGYSTRIVKRESRALKALVDKGYAAQVAFPGGSYRDALTLSDFGSALLALK